MSRPPLDLQQHDMGCFGCSVTNPNGFQLRFAREGDEVLTRHTVEARYSGPPGVVHGGVVAMLLDEVSCAAPTFQRDALVVTGELTVRYEKPCPIATELTARARIVEKKAKYFVVESRLLAGDTQVARSTGKFFPVG